jgi:hypothetical protein
MRTPLRIGWLLVGAIVGAPLLPSAPNQLEAQTPKHGCDVCHNLHGGSYSALSDHAVAEELCITCHGDGGPQGVPKQEGIHDGLKHTTPTSCWDCHDHEGSAGSNLFMIPEVREDLPQGGSATVTFQNNAAQADFIGTEGVCYVCHTDPGTQANGFAGHNGPDVCTNCHTHDGGFQGAGGACSDCHNSTRLASGHTHAPRRQVIGTGGDYDRTSVHVTNVTDDDCVVCHDQRTDHSTDDLGVLLYDHDDGTSIELAHDGDPNTNSTEAAKLEQFCLGCHGDGSADKTGVTFPTGAGAAQPFTGLATIPGVDSLVWAASSHEGNLTGGCYGDGAFGCHGNGHGSEKLDLLAPSSFAPDPITLYEEEEGFCFGCHDGTVTGAANIKAQFDSTTINWSESEWGLNQITTFNDRHDVSHAASRVSGAKIECVNCHRPHADNSSQKYNPDPDPANTPPSWTGQSAMDAFCADCHDGTLPTGVQDHTGGPMTNVANAWANVDRMGAVADMGSALLQEYMLVEKTVGAGGTNASSDGGGDMDLVSISSEFGTNMVLNCTQCHRPHPKAAADWPGAHKYDLLSFQDSIRLSDGRAIAYPTSVTEASMGSPAVYTGAVWDTGLITDSNEAGSSDLTKGGFLCNNCHEKEAMNGKTAGCATGGGCHSHGASMTGM